MLKLLKNQKGSLGIAIVIVIIGVLSGVSLSSVAFRDVRSKRLQLDALQQLHYLRSEVSRARIVISYLEAQGTPPDMIYLPERSMNVSYTDNRTTYRAKTKIETYTAFDHTGFLIRSLITAFSGTGQLMTEEAKSTFQRYGENFIRSLQTLAIFHYFSDIDRALDDVDGNIRFYGADVIHGRVHSNTDIWIRQAGGGDNNGWPTFYGLVTTAGVVQVFGGGQYPEELVFRGGLIENYPRVVFEPSAALVRQNGNRPLGETGSDNKIGFVTLNGLNYTARIGDIVNVEPPELFTIYDTYPPYGPVGDSIGVNIITRRDTLWSISDGTLANNTSNWIPFELWISGMVRGAQTWASSHNIYIKDDITYENTIPGQPPDGGPPDLIYPVNNYDYFGLISEQSIYIQYGHYCPIDTVRKKPNTNNIYLYGAYCAMGDAQGETTPNGIYAKDGVFTFQYHFPKGSTPNQFYQGEFFTKIDLHRYKYPTSAFDPWPPGLDYPWYNPIWPEPGPVFGVPAIPNPHGAPTVVFLRGNIYLFGSIAQRRRGFVRRSGNADYDTGIWDIPNHIFGRHTIGLVGTPPGGPTGYDKDYTFDTRFETKGPPDFPLVKFEGYESDEMMDLGYETISWMFKQPPTNF